MVVLWTLAMISGATAAIGAGVCAAIACLLLIVGLRGTKVHDRPTCRRCGFDVSGVPGVNATLRDIPATAVCAECGRSLARPGAVRRGIRRTRWTVLILGMVLLLSTLGGGSLFLLSSSNVKLNTYKPTWLLAIEAGSQDITRAAAALDELVIRADSAQLSGAWLSKLTDQGLREQGGGALVWLPQWASIIEAAHKSGAIDDARWSAFLRQGISIDAVVRSRVRQGEATPLALRVSGPRLGKSMATISMRVKSLAIGANTPALSLEQFEGESILGVSFGGVSSSSRDIPVDAPLGKQEIVAVVEVTLRRRGFQGISLAAEDRESNPVLAVHERRLTCAFEVLPPGTPLVKAIEPTPETMAQMTRAVRAENLSYSPSESYRRCSYTITATDLPVSAAFDVWWRWTAKDGSQREEKVGSVSFRAGSGQSGYGGGRDIRAFDAETIDVILRPSQEFAERTTDLDSYWNAELVLPRLNVTRNEPARPDSSPNAGGAAGTGSGGEPGK